MAYPDKIPARIPFWHEGTVSSDGKQTTTGANEEIDFGDFHINGLEITAFDTDLHIKFNDETNTHLIQAGGSKKWDAFDIRKFTIVENGAEYEYTGLYWTED